TALARPSFSGSRTTVLLAQAPSSTQAAMRAAICASLATNASLIGADDELGATRAEHSGRRAHGHRIGRLLGDAAGDDRQRAPVQRGVEAAAVGRGVEGIAVERKHAVRTDREQRIVVYRDPHRAVGAGPNRVLGLHPGTNGARQAFALPLHGNL